MTKKNGRSPQFSKGLYLLVLKLKKKQKIRAGRLQEAIFKPGIYLYIGRARRGLEGRLKRHLREDKKVFWHIDYLLQKAELTEIWIKHDSIDECRTALEIKNLVKDSFFPQKNFGSSDCRCPSHLLFLPENRAELKPILKELSFEQVEIHGN